METHLAWGNIVSCSTNQKRLSDEIRLAAFRQPPWHRKRFIHSRIMLAEMMYMLFGCTQLPHITLSGNGRPCFADPSLPDFNVSYTGNMVAITLSGDNKVGVDIEIVRVRQSHKYTELQQQCLTPAECIWLNGQNDPPEAATQLWTVRESVLKISSLGGSRSQTLQLQPASGKIRSSVTPRVQCISNVIGGIAWACSSSPAFGNLRYWQMNSSGLLENVDKQTARVLKDSSSCLHFSNLFCGQQENI